MSNDDLKDFEFPNLGARKSPEDYRNIPLSAAVPPPGVFPESHFVDVTALPVWNQMRLGACVGHAAGKYAQKINQTETGEVKRLSPRFLYALAKMVDGFDGQGTYPHLLVKQWRKYGCATEDTVPNDTTLDHEAYIYNRNINSIPKAAFDEALQYAIKSYAFPELTADGLRNAVLNANGCMILMQVDKNWWTNKAGQGSWKAEDILPLRPPTDPQGHELYVYGYDHVDGRLRFWIFNSWSPEWGFQGKGFFFFDEYQRYLIEANTVVDLPNDWLQHVHDLPAPGTFKHHFQTPIKINDTGEEVKALQTALYIDGELKVDPAIFGNYKNLTRAAVKAFQEKYQVASQAEIDLINGRSVGPKTRAKLNEIFNK